MKYLFKIAGLCLVAMFAMSMVAVATASAVEAKWEQCSEGTENKEPTKYTEHQCVKAAEANNGKWQWNEVKSTEKVVGGGTLILRDNSTLLGKVAVECAGLDTGTVGPGKFDRIEKITVASCKNVEHCTTLVKPAEPVNLPWQTELYQTENTVRDALRGTASGKPPGWTVTCEVLGTQVADECTSEEGTTLLENRLTAGELLVLAVFQGKAKSGSAKCSAGSATSGEVIGSLAVLKENKWGLRVS